MWPGPRVQSRDAMHARRAYGQLVAIRIRDHMDVMTHLGKRFRQLANRRWGTVVDRKRARRHHRDGIAVYPLPVLVGLELSHFERPLQSSGGNRLTLHVFWNRQTKQL